MSLSKKLAIDNIPHLIKDKRILMRVDFKTVLVVFARSFWRAPLRFGPGIKSAVAIRFINLEIER